MSNDSLKARAELAVPAFARDNYSQMARDIAAQEGVSPKAAMERLVAGWKQQHEVKPLDGYDLLAAWGEDHDPGDGSESLAGAAALHRAVESAAREPQQYLAGEEAVKQAAELALEGHVPNHETGPSARKADDVEKNAGPANLAGKSVDDEKPSKARSSK